MVLPTCAGGLRARRTLEGRPAKALQTSTSIQSTGEHGRPRAPARAAAVDLRLEAYSHSEERRRGLRAVAGRGQGRIDAVRTKRTPTNQIIKTHRAMRVSRSKLDVELKECPPGFCASPRRPASRGATSRGAARDVGTRERDASSESRSRTRRRCSSTQSCGDSQSSTQSCGGSRCGDSRSSTQSRGDSRSSKAEPRLP